MDFLIQNWEYVLLISAACINILNAATKSFDKYPSVVKWLMFVVEILSVLPSKDVLGALKFPFTVKK